MELSSIMHDSSENDFIVSQRDITVLLESLVQYSVTVSQHRIISVCCHNTITSVLLMMHRGLTHHLINTDKEHTARLT